MIKFKENTTLTIVEGFDEEKDNITEEYEASFKKGEKVDADICDFGEGKYVNLQFGYHGGLATNVLRSCFEVVK